MPASKEAKHQDAGNLQCGHLLPFTPSAYQSYACGRYVAGGKTVCSAHIMNQRVLTQLLLMDPLQGNGGAELPRKPQGTHHGAEKRRQSGADENDPSYHACSRCDVRDSEAAHAWDEGETVTAADCTTAGMMKYTCSECSATRTEEIPALGHDFSGEWAHDATNHWHKCTREGCSEVSDTAAHAFSEWAVTTEAQIGIAGEESRSCEVCGYSESQAVAALDPPAPVY